MCSRGVYGSFRSHSQCVLVRDLPVGNDVGDPPLILFAPLFFVCLFFVPVDFGHYGPVDFGQLIANNCANFFSSTVFRFDCNNIALAYNSDFLLLLACRLPLPRALIFFADRFLEVCGNNIVCFSSWSTILIFILVLFNFFLELPKVSGWGSDLGNNSDDGSSENNNIETAANTSTDHDDTWHC